MPVAGRSRTPSGTQLLGGQDPQCWKKPGPERAAALSFWTYSAVRLWYLACHGAQPTWTSRPWYPAKRAPSFADALAALRLVLWRQRIFIASDSSPHLAIFPNTLIHVLAEGPRVRDKAYGRHRRRWPRTVI